MYGKIFDHKKLQWYSAFPVLTLCHMLSVCRTKFDVQDNNNNKRKPGWWKGLMTDNDWKYPDFFFFFFKHTTLTETWIKIVHTNLRLACMWGLIELTFKLLALAFDLSLDSNHNKYIPLLLYISKWEKKWIQLAV